MNKINYQKELDKLLDGIDKENNDLRLLLHGCCAPCSSYCLVYLSEYFDITVLFYNPNIDTETEYIKREEELKRFILESSFKHKVDVICAEYNSKEFYDCVRGFEHFPEGQDRCFKCYELRMELAAKLAKENNYDYFCTTLSISPLKNAQKINEIGMELSEKYGVKWLPSDFKKKNGFKQSVQLSEEHNLYRQNFCGCIFSKKKEEAK